MDKYSQAEKSPRVKVSTDKQSVDFARQAGQTVYHPVGTCRMGDDKFGVVDAKLKVRGLEELRVVDASVMPKIVSENTQAAVLMIAEKAAGLIKEDRRERR